MLKKLWTKFIAWLTSSKIGAILSKIGTALRKFLRYAYAAQLSFLVLSVIFYLSVSKFAGILLIACGVVLLVVEYKQQKADQLNPQPEPPLQNAKPVVKKKK